jgi:prepilin-type N-terminal cleavage/methylation domain-containing protein
VHAVTARPTRGTPRRRAARAGFTLVEVIAAIMLLAIGLLAIAGLGVTAAKTTRRGSAQTLASAMAQSRFDSLSSVPCANLAPGSAPTKGVSTVRNIREAWVVTDGWNLKRLSDTLTVPGRATPLVYVSVIPCRE